MQLNAISKQYGVSLDTLKRFIEVGVLEGLEYDIKKDIYGDKAVKRLEECICLYSLGMSVETVKRYLLLENSKEDTIEERIHILQQQRNQNLKNVHATKKKMDCIDCILHEIKMNR